MVRPRTRLKMQPTRIDLWSVAILFVAAVWLVAAFYPMARNGSSPLFLLPPTLGAAIAIIHWRE